MQMRGAMDSFHCPISNAPNITISSTPQTKLYYLTENKNSVLSSNPTGNVMLSWYETDNQRKATMKQPPGVWIHKMHTLLHCASGVAA